MTSKVDHSQTPESLALLEESISRVREALAALKFGAVSVTVHEGRVVQIEVTERKRLKPN